MIVIYWAKIVIYTIANIYYITIKLSNLKLSVKYKWVSLLIYLSIIQFA